jgi:hypothetical protein
LGISARLLSHGLVIRKARIRDPQNERIATMNDLFRPDGAAVLVAEPVAAPTTTPEKPIAQAGTDNFDWSSENPDIVIQEQPQTAVYVNPFGSIVIRQEARDPYEDDQFVFFTPANIPALIERLRSMIVER